MSAFSEDYNGTSIHFYIETQGVKLDTQPRNYVDSTIKLAVFVIVVEQKDSHSKFIDNRLFLIQNLTIWIGSILVGGTIFLIIQKFGGIKLDNFTTPFLEMASAFFGGGTIRMIRPFVQVFVISMLFGSFFLNSIFAGELFNLYTTDSESRINTYEKLSKANYTYYYDELLRYHVGAINRTMLNLTGLTMKPESAEPKVISDLILKNQMPFAYVLLDLQLLPVYLVLSKFADFTVIEQRFRK